MRAYFYDIDGLFTGSREVSAPIPKSTEQKPPETWPPDIPRWTGETWKIVQDQRYRRFYHKASREEYVPEHSLEQVDLNFYVDVAPPGLDDYEYWDDVAEAWLIDTARKDADKADMLWARLTQELAELIIANPGMDLSTVVAARKAEIEAEIQSG